MRTTVTLFFALIFLSVFSYSQTVYNDGTGDIDPGLATGGGTLDIVSMEVSHTLTDFVFKLTVNGNVSTTDWGKFLIGIAMNTGGPSTATGNGWGRPINLDGPGAADMTHWIGTWVDAGGGAQLWSYNGSTWVGPTSPAFSISAGAMSTLTTTVPHTSLGTPASGTIYFDAYSSGGGGTDGAIDALANPAISVTAWGQTYTSSGALLKSYTWSVLPVELTSFTVSTQKDEVFLAWNTATELNNYGFEIERSILVPLKENTFETIGFIAGNGNSNSPKEYSYRDENLAPGAYAYRLKQIDTDGTFTYSNEVKVEHLVPRNFVLTQNYPNPFNPSTRISFSIPEGGNVKLRVFDLLGTEVATLVNSELESGTHTVDFNAAGLASGTYFYKLESGGNALVKKMHLIK